MSIICRYIEMNVRYSKSYSLYNEQLPHFLHNRPRDFVDHVRLRYSSAEHINTSGICSREHGLFQVPSERHAEQYTVAFGSSTEMPSCTCMDWEKYHWPCKHFCAVFKTEPEWGWDSLSPLYKDSPYFHLDEEVLQSEIDIRPGEGISASEDSQHTEGQSQEATSHDDDDDDQVSEGKLI